METNKKYFNRLAGGAVLLAGALAFTACSSDEDFVEAAAPGSNVTGETVKTQFSIAVPGTNSVNKRLGSDIVQADEATFRGMTGIRLVPFTVANPGAETVLEDGTTLPTPIALGDIASTGLQESTYKVYYDVEVPTTTNYFLFYGEALPGADATAKDNGSLVPSYETTGWPSGNLSGISFALEPIYTSGNIAAAQTALAAMLTDIANNTAIDGGTNWSAETGVLKTYRDGLLSLEAGSETSIKFALQDLYTSMGSEEVTEQNSGMKTAIQTKIAEYYTVDGQGNLTELKDGLAAYKEFPRYLGLPDGAMQIKYETADSKNVFEYVTPGSEDNLLTQTAYTNYVYPAALFYTQQTEIKTADQRMTDGDGIYNNWTTDWSTTLAQSGWTTNAVSTTTQSIALVDPVNYAVASFNLFVRFKNDGGYIYDNGDNYTLIGTSVPVGQKPVSIPEEGFPLTGVLVGDQKKVKWDFTTDATDQEPKTIYDASHTDAAVKQTDFSATPTAYTLALETEAGTATTGGAKTVRFALEMTNNSGAPFYGKDGIVPAGGTFYLVGSLSSEETVGGHLKVFEQDHTTVANVTINSLKNAYNCIPDLRSPKLELGLAVDLDWQEGLVSNVTIE